jgi:hypothetical protein
VACNRVNFTFTFTVPLPVHSVPAPEFKHHIVEGDLLFAASISLCTVLSAIVSQLFNFAVTSTFVVTKFCSALEIDDIRSVAANFPDIVTVGVCCLCTNVYTM